MEVYRVLCEVRTEYVWFTFAAIFRVLSWIENFLIWGSHAGVDEDPGLLGHDPVLTGKQFRQRFEGA